MKNKQQDLNDLLFKVAHELANPNLNDEHLKEEIARAKAISAVATVIVSNTKVCTEWAKFRIKEGTFADGDATPQQFRIDNKDI